MPTPSESAGLGLLVWQKQNSKISTLSTLIRERGIVCNFSLLLVLVLRTLLVPLSKEG